jgi:hypothetical protein
MLINVVFVFPTWSELFEISDFMRFETGLQWGRGSSRNNKTEICVCFLTTIICFMSRHSVGSRLSALRDGG